MPSGTLSQASIISFLGADPIQRQTPAETAAGVTPVNYTYAPGNVLRYGTNTTPGVTDMTTAINNALASNSAVFIPSGTYLVTGSLIYQDNQNIEGAGHLNTIVKGDLSNKSFFRSSYGETPSSGQRPVGVRIAKLGIFPATAATITSGSVAINLRNAQYCTVQDVLMQYTDIGMVTDQNGQFLRFERVHLSCTTRRSGRMVLSAEITASVIVLSVGTLSRSTLMAALGM